MILSALITNHATVNSLMPTSEFFKCIRSISQNGHNLWVFDNRERLVSFFISSVSLNLKIT